MATHGFADNQPITGLVETQNLYPHDTVLDTEVSDELPTDPSPTVESSRRLCYSPSALLGSAQVDQSARADEVPETGSVAAAATSDDERVPINTREFRANVKYHFKSLEGPGSEELAERLGLEPDAPLYSLSRA